MHRGVSSPSRVKSEAVRLSCMDLPTVSICISLEEVCGIVKPREGIVMMGARSALFVKVHPRKP